MAAFQEVDNAVDSVLRKVKPYIVPAARVCLVSTFLEDSVRMVLQSNSQSRYIATIWRCGYFLAYLFVATNFFIQLVPSVLLIMQKYVKYAFYTLVGAVIMQIIAYQMLFDIPFLLRNLGVIGGLLFVFADEKQGNDGNIFALPLSSFGALSGSNSSKAVNAMQLAGRVLVVVMFLTLTRFDSVIRILVELIGLVLVLAVAIGFQTKASASVLVLLLFLENVTFNAFWFSPTRSSSFDFKRYDFFQTMSVIGGLLMIVALGPGGISLDKSKKAM
eukprot:m.111018 g.111018  ORF g.111018 m.111018 type:complete len:274 (+) comp13417_c0_seq3:203-1024(+)